MLAIARVLAVVVCFTVRPSVRLSQIGVLLKRLNVRSCKQCHTIAQGLYVSDAENLGITQTGHPNGGAKYKQGRLNAAAVAKNWQFRHGALSTYASVASLSH